MTRWEPDEVAGVALLVVVSLVVVGLAIAFAVLTYDGLHGRHERAECGSVGGKVEFYDKEHDELWRCVKAERSGT